MLQTKIVACLLQLSVAPTLSPQTPFLLLIYHFVQPCCRLIVMSCLHDNSSAASVHLGIRVFIFLGCHRCLLVWRPRWGARSRNPCASSFLLRARISAFGQRFLAEAASHFASRARALCAWGSVACDEIPFLHFVASACRLFSLLPTHF